MGSAVSFLGSDRVRLVLHSIGSDAARVGSRQKWQDVVLPCASSWFHGHLPKLKERLWSHQQKYPGFLTFLYISYITSSSCLGASSSHQLLLDTFPLNESSPSSGSWKQRRIFLKFLHWLTIDIHRSYLPKRRVWHGGTFQCPRMGRVPCWDLRRRMRIWCSDLDIFKWLGLGCKQEELVHISRMNINEPGIG